MDRALLFSYLDAPGTLLLESSRQDPSNNRHLLFHSPLDVLSTDRLQEVPSIFSEIEKYLNDQKWVSGYVSYECGYHFDTIIPAFTHDARFPLLWFGVYDHPVELSDALLSSVIPDQTQEIIGPQFTMSDEEYRRRIARLKEYIVNGDTYQVNFTDRFEFTFSGDARELYFSLRQKQRVPYSAFINTGSTHVLSFSPELFFRRNNQMIVTKPMKGTHKRGRTNEEDHRFSEWLQHDEKNRSENLMIVDLLRNDIGRICQHGSVGTADMYSVEKLETVLQMTSTVTGTLKPGIHYYDIFKALFPCGSVTGAPKIRTMQIINEVEQHRRGVYCGAIGFISPNQDSVFNVAIRTLQMTNGNGVMGVGSGIVFDSDADRELEECKLKAAFLLEKPKNFQLIETIKWQNGYAFLHQHLQRMKNSAEYFAIPFRQQELIDILNMTARSLHVEAAYRVRILLSQTGTPTIESSILHQETSPVVKIADIMVHSQDKFLYHKTTNREMYDHYRVRAATEEIADYIFFNENNELTEGTINNVFIEIDGRLYTPPIFSGVLPGIYRNEVLSTNPLASEKIITRDECFAGKALFLCNSVRGWRKVTLSA